MDILHTRNIFLAIFKKSRSVKQLPFHNVYSVLLHILAVMIQCELIKFFEFLNLSKNRLWFTDY